MDHFRRIIRRAKRQLKDRHVREIKQQRLEKETLKYLGQTLINKTYQLNDVARVARRNKEKHDRVQKELDDEYIEEAERALGTSENKKEQETHHKKINRILKQAQEQRTSYSNATGILKADYKEIGAEWLKLQDLVQWVAYGEEPTRQGYSAASTSGSGSSSGETVDLDQLD